MKNSVYFTLSLLLYVNILLRVASESAPLEPPRETFQPHCPTVNVLLESNYTKSCANEPKNFLCLALNDLGKKWCLRKSQQFQLPDIENATILDSNLAKFEPETDPFFEVSKYCKTPKSKLDKRTNDTNLFKFYNDDGFCVQHCLDPSSDNLKPKKICTALAWFAATIQSAVKKNIPPPENIESKPEEPNIPVVKISNKENISEQYTVTKSKEDKKTSTNKIKTPTAKNVSSLSNKTPEIPKIQNVPTLVDPEKLPKSNDELDKKDPNLKSNKKDEPVVTNDEKIVQDNSDVIAKTPQLKINDQSPVIENTEARPDTNKKTETVVSATEKKIEQSSIKTGNVEKNEDVKSSTISENTNDFDDSAREEIDAPPINKIDDDQNKDIGTQNKEPEPPEEKKLILRYPGKKVVEESHVFSYFVAFSLLFVCFYIGYLNKKKILAMLLEGRRSRNGRGRRRPSTANYRKLDCNLEEAVTSQCNSNVTNVIY